MRWPSLGRPSCRRGDRQHAQDRCRAQACLPDLSDLHQASLSWQSPARLAQVRRPRCRFRAAVSRYGIEAPSGRSAEREGLQRQGDPCGGLGRCRRPAPPKQLRADPGSGFARRPGGRPARRGPGARRRPDRGRAGRRARDPGGGLLHRLPHDQPAARRDPDRDRDPQARGWLGAGTRSFTGQPGPGPRSGSRRWPAGSTGASRRSGSGWPAWDQSGSAPARPRTRPPGGRPSWTRCEPPLPRGDGTEPRGDVHGAPDYRRHLARVLTGRALAAVAGV